MNVLISMMSLRFRAPRATSAASSTGSTDASAAFQRRRRRGSSRTLCLLSRHSGARRLCRGRVMQAALPQHRRFCALQRELRLQPLQL